LYITCYLDREAIRKAIVDLRSYSLVFQSVKDRSLSIHSLVHKYAGTALLSDEDARLGLARRVIEVVVAAFDLGKSIGSEDADSWTHKLRILPHASHCSEILQFDLAPPAGRALDAETRRLTYRLAQGFSQLGHVQGVNALYELGLRGVEPSSAPAGDLAEVVDMMNSFGVSLRLQADYDEATAWHERAKDFIEKMPPDPCRGGREKGIRVLEVERYMAAILIDQELFEAAKIGLERVLERQRLQRELHIHKNQDKENRNDNTTNNGNDNATALEIQTQHDLGEILQALGLREQALEKFQLVHEYRRKKHGDNDAATLEAAHSVAMILEEKGQYSESLALHQENLGRRKRYLGEGHYSTLDTMDSIASVYERQGQYEASLQQYREVLVKLERILFGAAADHPWLLRVRSSLADVELRQGLFAEALDG
jgi:tetratricopeptide (TPR) repeat protein